MIMAAIHETSRYQISRALVNRTSLLNRFRISTRTVKYRVNHSFLDKGIISHGHAWFWGLLLTDGNVSSNGTEGRVNRVKWKFKYDEHVVLEKLRALADSTHPICFGADRQYYFCELGLNSTRLAGSAVALLDCDARKKTFNL